MTDIKIDATGSKSDLGFFDTFSNRMTRIFIPFFRKKNFPFMLIDTRLNGCILGR
ncbi:MAG: hypothetical protein KOO65_09470 [Desulfobacterales bacterium]|nr:hypothetical protein [Desulfobacterales bacterium]